jgi:hypothetical protein
MASYAYTFTSGDTVTPTKLNSARTVSDIVNADIKSDAAIAGTKIAPDFGSQNVVTTGNVLINATSRAVGTTSVGNFQLETTSAGASIVNNRNDNVGAIFSLGKSRSTTIGGNTIVQSGDTLGQIRFAGADGGDLETVGAWIVATVDGTPGANDMPSRLIFGTTADGDSSPTERMRIDSSGNVGIGTASPQKLLDIRGASNPEIRFQSTDGTNAALYFGDQTDAVKAGIYYDNTNNALTLQGYNNSERMRIHATGTVTIGTTAAFSVASGSDDGMSIGGNGTASISRDNNPPLFLRRRSGNGTIAGFYRDTTSVGSISVTTTATAFNTSSDYRLKQNVEPMVGGLTKLAALAPKTFEFKADPNVKVDGFIAHEVQTVVPQAVTGEKDGEEMQGLDMSKLVPVLVAAVQELSAKVAALENA